MTHDNQLPPYTYDNFQKLFKEVVELRKLSLSLADQLEKAKTKKE